MRGRWRATDGGTSAEMVAVIVVVAAVVAAVWSIGVDRRVEETGTAATCQLFGGDCPLPEGGEPVATGDQPGAPSGGQDPVPSPSPGPSPEAPQDGGGGDDAGDRERGGREGDERSRREDGRDGRRGDGDTDPPPPGDGTDGPPAAEAGLGDPVPGTSALEPDPPSWQPPDAGAGEHDSEGKGIRDRLRREAVELAAHAFGLRYPNAGANLLHFLGNSGEDREQDVDEMLDDIPEFEDHVDERTDDLALLALERAQQEGIDGPVTFPVSTPWVGFGYDDSGAWAYDNRDWQLALGGWQTSITGTVTVYPPENPGDPWRTETDTTVHLRDQYNWDAGKSTNIAGLPVSDADLAKLHRVGLAQEYLNRGTSSSRSNTQEHP